MSSDKIFKIKQEWSKNAIVSKTSYENLYEESITDNENFWKKHGQRIEWVKPYSKIKDVKYSSKDVHIKWYYDGTLNASTNCIDRHALVNPDRIAIIWEGDNPALSKKISYKELMYRLEIVFWFYPKYHLKNFRNICRQPIF